MAVRTMTDVTARGEDGEVVAERRFRIEEDP
jgi:hypothetical protein